MKFLGEGKQVEKNVALFVNKNIHEGVHL